MTAEEAAAKLKELLDRDKCNSAQLTIDERCFLLNRIYDRSLISWVLSSLDGSNKGTSGFAHQLERARLELDAWAPSATQVQTSEQRFIGWETPKADELADA